MIVLVLVRCLHAGHSLWERSIRSGELPDTASVTLDKRYFIFEPKDTYRVWPNSEIRYCFENEATKEKLIYTLQYALSRWFENGLPAEHFKMTEVSDAECRDNRAEVLLIKYNDQGKLSTHVGIPPLNPKEKDYVGPIMNLSDREDVGMLDVVANYAHELGHAWGLLHEHQNPAWWGSPYNYGGFRQLFTFNCQNLKDYAEVAERLSPEEMEEACTSRNKAEKAKFTAVEYLPQLSGGRGEGPLAKLDKESIMLYPSGAGATGEASPGNDQRTAILLDAKDGTRLPINTKPSKRDIDGILKLYNTDWGTTNPTLLNQPGNSKSSRFRNLFKKNGCL